VSERPLDEDEPVLDDYPVVAEVVVRWGDIDLLGHVNNIKYLQYFESARVEYLMRIGMEAPGTAWREFGFILSGVECRYKAPVTFPDTLSVGARVSVLGDERLVFQHAAYSHKLGKLAALGEAFLVAYDYAESRRTAIPSDLRSSIVALEGKELPSPASLKERRRKP
jgi:acyl-CoA thioester hydrolase